ncbi:MULTISPECIES: phosphodiester glycosidase family protein [Pseudarthrobacter]|jgi:exopolysaccharide biosynthesis protein|uniref:phosphodiester glycosidase family protein n=1 Tax=Pseudarthrobacter TaxID=1742993 RepID=UPI0013DAFC19|nr:MULTISPECIES: phosphodiester glycosidase family protein [Pseudarthrobacter]MDP9998848.1 exopolysaccharide biosynthesis protein [Pseudarthrobacter sulfonivorans]QOD02881.1 phosphodiester glycosidase family protein [Pseudarthrobacter sp. BIM B-2242]
MTPLKNTKRQGSRIRRAVVAGAVALTLSAGGATAWALDRFVVQHVEISDVSAYEASQLGTSQSGSGQGTTAGTAAGSATAVTTDTSYSSDSSEINISTVTTGSGDSTVTYYVADVVLDDATALQSAFAENSFGENITETTSAIAEANNAVFAINGDYYGFRDTGIVIRNGVVFRDEGARQGLAFYRDGTVKVYDETATTAEQLVADGVWNTLSFGPSLLDNGEVAEGIEDVEVDTNFGNHSIQGEQPRTAVGIIDANHLVFVVVDGRSPGYSAGVTLTGLAEIMQGLGATTAYNLDGGGSSTMYFNGSLVNNPLGANKERGTSDILYIAG